MLTSRRGGGHARGAQRHAHDIWRDVGHAGLEGPALPVEDLQRVAFLQPQDMQEVVTTLAGQLHFGGSGLGQRGEEADQCGFSRARGGWTLTLGATDFKVSGWQTVAPYASWRAQKMR